MTPVWSVRTHAMDSSAPDAPSAWPSIDLLELIGIWYACSPSANLMAAVSDASLSCVDVPWALM
jgi:hypothetical protein